MIMIQLQGYWAGGIAQMCYLKANVKLTASKRLLLVTELLNPYFLARSPLTWTSQVPQPSQVILA